MPHQIHLSKRLFATACSVLLISSVGAFLASTSPSPSRPSLLLSSSSLSSSTHGTIISTSSSSSSPSSSTPPMAYVDESYPRATTTDASTKSKASNDNVRTEIESTSSSHASSSHASSAAKNKPPKILPNGGRITLVGAGPGSPDLLTVAAHRIITDPNNLLIVDRLVSNEILDLIEGEYRVANKHPGCQHAAQDEIYDWCIGGLREGRHVVRLKIGDPFVFGRGGEEVLEFRDFGVEPTVIPGVSAAFSAPLLGSIPVTHRGVSNQVVMCTGYGRNNTSPDLIKYHPEQTVVFLMAVGRLRTLCDNLVSKAGFPVDTPVGIVERAGCPDQRTVVGTMVNIADLAKEYDVKPPSTIVVGEVVNVLLTEEDFGSVATGEGVVQQGLVRTLED
eukprot:CAMPEP_0181129692 /NCGR_PEP_ID=MMETSP1071-20121207/29459_1 /TAXON_ID=35127 /ORGANISM="Thalassiosira sp., Strain NH16" /LENGTH=390 /DNA_ID=CAMNT_0023215699 /DNA_START=293 /DNA_END=1465 /DNA_ORIENTATION=-